MSLAILSPPVADRQPDLAPIVTDPGQLAVRRIRLVGRLVALLLCLLHAYTNRHLINPDGISYFDVASAWMRGDLREAINGYWSPLYSWLLAGVFTLLQPSPYWECAVAHGVTVFGFLVALVAFEWLLAEVLAMRSTRERSWQALLPDWLVVGVAYALFAWVCRRLITVSLLTPDMLVAAGLFASSALLLRLWRSENASLFLSLLLGVILGLSYLAKAIMLPLAVVFLGLVLLGKGPRWRRLAAATLVLAVVAGPWIAVLSWTRGRPTFGESGRLNYLWYVQGQPRLPRSGAHLLSDKPVLAQWRQLRSESYPLWFDPSRFHTSDHPRFTLAAQLRASSRVGVYYGSLLGETLSPFSLLVVVFVLFAFFARRGSVWSWGLGWGRDLIWALPILAPALLGLGLYLVVGHAEGRLVGPFVVSLGLAILGSLRLPHPRQATVRPFGAAWLVLLAMMLGGTLIHDLASAVSAYRRGEGAQTHPHWQVARTLREIGVEPGDGVASIGFTYNAYWARLGQVHCVAEIPHPEASSFWSLSSARQAELLTLCRLAGARAVVSDCAPSVAPGWRKVPGTSFAVRQLDPRRTDESLAKRGD